MHNFTSPSHDIVHNTFLMYMHNSLLRRCRYRPFPFFYRVTCECARRSAFYIFSPHIHWLYFSNFYSTRSMLRSSSGWPCCITLYSRWILHYRYACLISKKAVYLFVHILNMLNDAECLFIISLLLTLLFEASLPPFSSSQLQVLVRCSICRSSSKKRVCTRRCVYSEEKKTRLLLLPSLTPVTALHMVVGEALNGLGGIRNMPGRNSSAIWNSLSTSCVHSKWKNQTYKVFDFFFKFIFVIGDVISLRHCTHLYNQFSSSSIAIITAQYIHAIFLSKFIRHTWYVCITFFWMHV